MMDFSIPDEPKRFRVAPDVFEAPAVIPAKTLRRFAAMAEGLATAGEDFDSLIDSIAEAMKAILPGEPGEKFALRLLSDGAPGSPAPIDLKRQVVPILHWLLEQYGLRPTQPSSASADGSTDGTAAETTPNDGTDSTAGPSQPELATT